MSAGPVERFSRARAFLMAANEADEITRTTDDPVAINRAEAVFFSATGQMVEELNALDDSGALDEIAEFLEITYGGGQS